MNNLTFAEKYTITELNYNGVAPDPEEFEMPTDTSMSHLTTPYLVIYFSNVLYVFFSASTSLSTSSLLL